MNELSSYWQIQEDSFHYPSLHAAKCAVMDFFKDRVPVAVTQRSRIDHVVNGYISFSVIITVFPNGKIQFSRPQRV